MNDRDKLLSLNWATIISGGLYLLLGFMGWEAMGLCGLFIFPMMSLPFFMAGITDSFRIQSYMPLTGIILLVLGVYSLVALMRFPDWDDAPILDKIIANISVIAGFIFAFLFIFLLGAASSAAKKPHD